MADFHCASHATMTDFARSWSKAVFLDFTMFHHVSSMTTSHPVQMRSLTSIYIYIGLVCPIEPVDPSVNKQIIIGEISSSHQAPPIIQVLYHHGNMIYIYIYYTMIYTHLIHIGITEHHRFQPCATFSAPGLPFTPARSRCRIACGWCGETMRIGL